jgi:hypothetical protein
LQSSVHIICKLANLRKKTSMTTASELSVTLTAPLWTHLRHEADLLKVPIELLIAGLVCDTIEAIRFPDRTGAPARTTSETD